MIFERLQKEFDAARASQTEGNLNLLMILMRLTDSSTKKKFFMQQAKCFYGFTPLLGI